MAHEDGSTADIRRLRSVRPLHEEEFVQEEIFKAWSAQHQSRGNTRGHIESSIRLVRRFLNFAGGYAWTVGPGDFEAWIVSLVSEPAPIAKSTLRGYQGRIRVFFDFVTDGRYGWAQECVKRFGQAPEQVCHEWNTRAHLLEYEGAPEKRPLTFDEIETLFAYADDQVERKRRAGKKGVLTALRDGVILKTSYAFGLRRSEVAKLDVADLHYSPGAPSLRQFGALQVRWGKGSRGSGPKRRTVLTVAEMDWIVDVLDNWLEEGRPLYTKEGTGALWPTERLTRINPRRVSDIFDAMRLEAGLPSELTHHSLRHSYVTHLTEFGYSPKFIQDQVGHVFGSTTSLYTHVSDDFMMQELKRGLRRTYGG